MTDEQINAAIHAALGNPLGCPRCSDPECAYNSGINYCTDLNAMHEADGTLTSQQRLTYETWLVDMDPWYVRYTARQRAEAFLRTLDRWEEAE